MGASLAFGRSLGFFLGRSLAFLRAFLFAFTAVVGRVCGSVSVGSVSVGSGFAGASDAGAASGRVVADVARRLGGARDVVFFFATFLFATSPYSA
jgi:hypothetical protein